ncbi:unnamed protein product [Ceratitis capitata]|uniref:(Mediterranean fruit fly) hypothetical protein n=1 Tax=Ceratitis capitata TaxID=7213 RepID=A0A811VFG6_CERCA|nr:unnamed protein product [Ceratitis capitata]
MALWTIFSDRTVFRSMLHRSKCGLPEHHGNTDAIATGERTIDVEGLTSSPEYIRRIEIRSYKQPTVGHSMNLARSLKDISWLPIGYEV